MAHLAHGVPFLCRPFNKAPLIGNQLGMTQDLYAILGISKSASAGDVRRAYKRLAKELHPDLHPDDSAKAEKFKRVTAAYEILGDAAKRRQYDNGEIDASGNPPGFDRSANFGDWRRGGFDRQHQDPFDDILSGMFGGGRRRPGPSKGQDMRYRVKVSFEDAVMGARRDMTMADGRVLNVAIPPGIESGQTLRLKSQGHPSRTGGPPGDAMLEVSVGTSSLWRRDEDDLRMDVEVPLSTALLGGIVDIQTPSGQVAMKIPEGSNSGANLRLRHRGVQRPGRPGHLYARLLVMIDDPKDKELKNWARKHRET